ncbi:hypothetical protein NDU88_002363 [Pleurodeles waltl]|uniref:Uncharacterized protein n=1 Tax=Pleurodeles waltl TaxID=8319 RepID=A0AAV7M1Y7_PLEWA|nr:hypothetical protein NDU88_002363 [Pleurodeles waltl]
MMQGCWYDWYLEQDSVHDGMSRREVSLLPGVGRNVRAAVPGPRGVGAGRAGSGTRTETLLFLNILFRTRTSPPAAIAEQIIVSKDRAPTARGTKEASARSYPRRIV